MTNPGSEGWPAPPPYPQVPPPYPGMPYPGGPYGAYPAPGFATRQRPDGAAIAAAILAALGAISALMTLVGLGVDLVLPISHQILDAMGISHWVLWLRIVGSAVDLIALGVGSILLFLRKPVGRWLVVAGCAVFLFAAIATLVAEAGTVSQSMAAIMGPMNGMFAKMLLMSSIVGLAPPIATAILALLPRTGRWLARAGEPERGRPPTVEA